MRALSLRSVGVAVALLCVAPSAFAQDQERVDVYHFDDDDLIGETMGAPPPLLRLRTKLPRVMLIRPRASFVGEMLKSVEVS